MTDIYIGEKQLQHCYIDTKKVIKIYRDTNLIWENTSSENLPVFASNFWVSDDDHEPLIKILASKKKKNII